MATNSKYLQAKQNAKDELTLRRNIATEVSIYLSKFDFDDLLVEGIGTMVEFAIYRSDYDIRYEIHVNRDNLFGKWALHDNSDRGRVWPKMTNASTYVQEYTDPDFIEKMVVSLIDLSISALEAIVSSYQIMLNDTKSFRKKM